MTRRDYRLIASAIRAERALMSHSVTQGELDAVHNVSVRIADVLAYDNPRFNRDTFMQACSFDRDKG